MVVEDMVKKTAIEKCGGSSWTGGRATQEKIYDFVIGRAVTALPTFFGWVQ